MGGVPDHPTFDLDGLVRQCLDEDLGGIGDVTSEATVPEGARAEGRFVAKESGVLAGVQVAERVFECVDASISRTWNATDGAHVERGDVIGTLEGPARTVLVAERLALNFMQRMSGIATLTSRMVDQLGGSQSKLLDTRKTVPGLRVLDKWAVVIGGGKGHRMGLYDMMLIKDNHIAASGGIANALSGADAYLNDKRSAEKVIPVEIEVETAAQVGEVLSYLDAHPTTSLTRVMLDNMVIRSEDGTYDTSLLEESVRRIGGRLETEASGNINIDSVESVGRTGVTFISSGALTHSVKALDISLKLKTHA